MDAITSESSVQRPSDRVTTQADRAAAASGAAPPSIEDAFRWIARLEGCSLLLLLGVAMPLKYVLKQGEPNAYIGWAHGSLFVMYLLCLGSVRRSSSEPAARKWLNYGLGVVASVIPAGTFVLEWWMRRAREADAAKFPAHSTPPGVS